MTVFVNGRVTFRCVRLSASEIGSFGFVWKIVYRARRRLLMSFYREAMQDFEASDEIDRGGSSRFVDGARRAVGFPGQATDFFRKTHTEMGSVIEAQGRISRSPNFHEGKMGQFIHLPFLTSAYADLPSSILVHCPVIPVLVFLAKIHDPPNSSFGVRGRQ